MLIYRVAVFSLFAVWVNSSPIETAWLVQHHRVARQTEADSIEVTPLPSDLGKEPEILYPRIDSMVVESQIQLRYATTKVTSRVLNPADKAQEVSFHLVLPDTAYISGFLMRIKGEEYVAEVKEKKAAQEGYDAAVSSGQTAAQVATTNARDANQFTVSVNVAAAEKVEFELKYEELLVRRLGKYEHAIHVNPGTIVPNLQIRVKINESLPVKVDIVDLRNDVNLDTEGEPKKMGNITQISETQVEINFQPSAKEQESFSKDGIQGQFVVQYEVDHSSLENKGGEIQVIDGYFVHFFAPSDLPVLPKHVAFVLDTSGSMYGEKLEQTKQAMKSILDQLTPQDHFSIVEFNYEAKEWDLRKDRRPEFNSPWASFPPLPTLPPLPPLPPRPSLAPLAPPLVRQPTDEETTDTTTEVPTTTPTTTTTAAAPVFGPYDDLNVYPANNLSISKAKEFVDSMVADGGTNINGALLLALKSVHSLQQKLSSRPAPIIVFLTDGEPTSGVTGLDEILTNTAKANSDGIVSIFSLAFGRGADFNFLKKVSLQNKGFARKIYEASDAALQLKGFFSEIASPLLSDVTFSYVGEVENVTETVVPKYFAGGELVIAGKVADSLTILVSATSADGPYIVRTNRTRTTSGASTFLERLWAYLTIKELIKKSETQDAKSLKDKALDLSLKYKFVTPLTSLLVVKPNGTSIEELKPADEDRSSTLGLQFSPPVLGAPQSFFAGPYPVPVAAVGLSGPPRPGYHASRFPTTSRPSAIGIPLPESAITPDVHSESDDDLIPSWLQHLPHNSTHVTITKDGVDIHYLWGFQVPKTYGVCPSPQGNSTVPSCVSPWDCSFISVFNVDDICAIEDEYIGVCCVV